MLERFPNLKKAVDELVSEAQEKSELNEIQAAHKLLEQHYGEPVMPVSKYCEKLRFWLHAYKHIDDVQRMTMEIDIRKSNLLHRLLYLDEEPRTQKCPIHNGVWSGCKWGNEACTFCMSGENVTGWVRPGIKIEYHDGPYEVFDDDGKS